MLVPQSKAATRVTWALDGHAGTGRPPRAQRVEHLVTQRVHAASLRQRLSGEHVQALHPVGHAAGRDPRDLGHLADRRPGLEIGLVGAPVGRRELRVAASRSVISFISPEASSVPISEAARGQVR